MPRATESRPASAQRGNISLDIPFYRTKCTQPETIGEALRRKMGLLDISAGSLDGGGEHHNPAKLFKALEFSAVAYVSGQQRSRVPAYLARGGSRRILLA